MAGPKNWIEQALRNTFSPKTLSKGKDLVEDIGDLGEDFLANTGIKPDTYRYSLYGYDQNTRKPDFRWLNQRNEEWVEDSRYGKNLPKRSKKIIGDYAKKWQYEQLQAGNTHPWDKSGNPK